MSAKWITVEKFHAETGYTPDAIQKKRERGVWLEGVVWRKAPDGRILMNLEGYHQWVEGTGYDQHRRRAS